MNCSFQIARLSIYEDLSEQNVWSSAFQSIIVTLTTVVLRIPLFEGLLCPDSLPSKNDEIRCFLLSGSRPGAPPLRRRDGKLDGYCQDYSAGACPRIRGRLHLIL